MIPLSVPEQDRRLVLRSFWFVICAIGATVVAIAAWLVHWPWWALGIVAFVAPAWLAFSNEHLVRRLYHAWNNRIIRPLSNLATAIILRVCLLVVFAATGRAGSRLILSGKFPTMWNGRDDSSDHVGSLPFGVHGNGVAAPHGWIRNYVRWAIRSHNAWAIFLIPFFCLLRMVSAEEPAGTAGNIYTLF
jgi:hypothetical protein